MVGGRRKEVVAGLNVRMALLLVILHVVISFGAAPHSSVQPQYIHSESEHSLRNSRPENGMLPSPAGLRSAKSASSWRSWRLDVTDDKNEVLRLRSFLCEAEEDVHHLSEDLIDAKQAQQRANQALKAKDQKLTLVAKELEQIKQSQAMPVNGEEQSELNRFLLQQGLRTEKGLEEYILSRALTQATEMVEEMRTEWEANRVIELAKAKTEGERKIKGLEQQLLSAREQMVGEQRRFGEQLAAKHRIEESEHITQLLQNLAQVREQVTAQREAKETAEERERKALSDKGALELSNRRLSEQLRSAQALAEQEQQQAVKRQAEEVSRRAVLLKRVASLERMRKEGEEQRGAEEEESRRALREARLQISRLEEQVERLRLDEEKWREEGRRKEEKERQKEEEEQRRRREEREERRRGEEELAQLRALLQAEQAQRQRANSTLVATYAEAEAEKTRLGVALAAEKARAEEREREMEAGLKEREAAQARVTQLQASLSALADAKLGLEARVRELEREEEERRREAEEERAARAEQHNREVEALTEQIETLILAAPLVQPSPSPTRNGKEQEMEMMEREVGRLRRALDEKRAELKAVSSLTPPPDFSPLQLSTILDPHVQQHESSRREASQHVEYGVTLCCLTPRAGVHVRRWWMTFGACALTSTASSATTRALASTCCRTGGQATRHRPPSSTTPTTTSSAWACTTRTHTATRTRTHRPETLRPRRRTRMHRQTHTRSGMRKGGVRCGRSRRRSGRGSCAASGETEERCYTRHAPTGGDGAALAGALRP